MPFCFAGQEVLAKQPVQEFLPRRSIAKAKQKMVKHVINANPVFHSMKERH
jgi:hypothetical protein